MKSSSQNLNNAAYPENQTATLKPRRVTVGSLGALFLLSCVAFLGYYDRFLTSIVAQAIKEEMNVSDTQIGLMSGLVFASFYTLLAVPIARYSDKGHRITVLTVSLTIWSLMTVLCGLATNYAMLLAARLGVGAGEAGGNPTIHALVSEIFDKRWRATALSCVTVVGGLGLMAASSVGGWIVDHWGWRAAFYAGALPGPFLAVLLYIFIKEPAKAVEARSETMLVASKILFKRKTFLKLCLGVGVCSIATFAIFAWAPAFLMRHYGLSAGYVGKYYGLSTGLATILGMLLGGIVSDLLVRRDARWAVWFPAFSFALALPFTIAFVAVKDVSSALVLAAPMTFFAMLPSSPCYSLVQFLAGDRYRATASALFMLFMYLIGMGIGPALAGKLSELFMPYYGSDSLLYALGSISVFNVIGATILILGSRSLRADLLAADE